MIDADFLEAHLALGDATLDFVINEHRMKVIAQSKNPGLIYQVPLRLSALTSTCFLNPSLTRSLAFGLLSCKSDLSHRSLCRWVI